MQVLFLRTQRISVFNFNLVYRVCRNYRNDDEVFLCSVGGDLLVGSEGPWTRGMSVSLSSPKLVMNSTTPGAETPGDLDLDRDDDMLQHAPAHYYYNNNNNNNPPPLWLPLLLFRFPWFHFVGSFIQYKCYYYYYYFIELGMHTQYTILKTMGQFRHTGPNIASNVCPYVKTVIV